jgi:phosphohistidine phosphatase
MKILYLVRHAKSSWDDPLQEDFDRPLNNRGRTDAPRMGKKLSERGIHPDLLLSSPAERAISTCVIIAEKIGYSLNNIHTDKRLYHASEETLLRVVREMNDANDEVMLFSHNPGLTDFANRLTPRMFTDNVPTCGVVALGLAVNSWAEVTWGTAKLRFFDFPKNKTEVD